MMKQVDIAGGGVAGLALGLALNRAGVPVRVHEAGNYPRHRLCGEFLSGVGASEFEALGLNRLFEETEVLRDMVWYAGNRRVLRDVLPEPAHGLSRWRMEAAMVEELTARDGVVCVEDRVQVPAHLEGWVVATGRPPTREGRWYGEKEHFLDLDTGAGLEMHLGNNGYAGLARVGQGIVNVCALFPASLGRLPQAGFIDRVRACGLTDLADRLERSKAVPGSHCGTSRFVTGRQPGNPDQLRLGDHAFVIPPFTGHGMSMAIQAALESAPTLTKWWSGEQTWTATVQEINAALDRRFRARLGWASRLHPVLLHPAGRFFLRLILRTGINPAGWLYHKVR